MKHELENSLSSFHLLQPRTCKGGDCFHSCEHSRPHLIGSHAYERSVQQRLQVPLSSPGSPWVKQDQCLSSVRRGGSSESLSFDDSGVPQLNPGESAPVRCSDFPKDSRDPRVLALGKLQRAGFEFQAGHSCGRKGAHDGPDSRDLVGIIVLISACPAPNHLQGC